MIQPLSTGKGALETERAPQGYRLDAGWIQRLCLFPECLKAGGDDDGDTVQSTSPFWNFSFQNKNLQ